MIISHPHKDHIQDLPNLLESITIKTRCWNHTTPERLIYPSDTTSLREPLLSWYNMSRTFIHKVPYELSILNKNFVGGVDINTFFISEEYLNGSAKENINNYSLLTTINYKDLLLIFPGDLEPAGWEAVIDYTQFTNYLTGTYKILIAPHHGRKSGIRLSDNSIYTRFMEILKPNLTIISDKRGNETTDPDTYRRYSSGIYVICGNEEEYKQVLTTKTSECVTIAFDEDKILIKKF